MWVLQPKEWVFDMLIVAKSNKQAPRFSVLSSCFTFVHMYIQIICNMPHLLKCWEWEGMYMIWSAFVMPKRNLCAYRVGPKLEEPTLFKNAVITSSRCLNISV